MTEIPVTLGALSVPGVYIRASAITWIYPDGSQCRPHQIIGFCNISLQPPAGAPPPFAGEAGLQVAFAAPLAGRFRIAPETSLGGYLNFLGVQFWDSSAIVGYLDVPDEPAPQTASLPMRHCMLAGKLLTGLADYGTFLLPGWHSHVRAWWQHLPEPPPTLLCLGICDAAGPIMGAQAAFLEIFEEHRRPCHIVVVRNDVLVPCAPCLLEQFVRTPEEFARIAQDIAQAVFNGPVQPAPADYIFIGALLDALQTSPIRQTHDIITPAGLQKTRPPAAILLSAAAEHMRILRHKTLGYSLMFFHFRLAAAGPATKAWLKTAFETVTRSIADIKTDYLKFFSAVQPEMDARFIILNRMSTSGREDIAIYAPFDAPMSQTLSTIAAKEFNLMLHALETIAIVDVDAAAAELGGERHLPDGVHQSGEMQDRIRREILRQGCYFF